MRKLKESVIYGLYALGSLGLIGGLFVHQAISNTEEYISTRYVTKNIFDEVYPVINISKGIEKPFNDASVKVVSSFYDYKEENHENSIIYYENTYMPNTGVIYKGESKFDCLAIYEGEVVKLEEDEIMGTIVTIKHDENIMSIYGSLQNVKVKEGDIVNKMDVIGEAGKNNLSSSLGEHLHFELIVNGKNVDPEKNYGKTLVELNK